MLKNFQLIEKILIFIVLIASVFGFWYFEPNLYLESAVILMALVGLYFSFFSKTEIKYSFQTSKEFLNLLILYLGLYTLYNLLFGLGIPLYLIMIAVLILGCFLFFVQLSLDKVNILMDKNSFHLYIILLGLIVLEVLYINGNCFCPLEY